jgi:hypothetical protein
MKTLTDKTKHPPIQTLKKHPQNLAPANTAQELDRDEMRSILAVSPVQCKLNISQPEDSCEQEARRVAHQVVTMPEPAPESLKISNVCNSDRSSIPRAGHDKGATAHETKPPHDFQLGTGKPLTPSQRSFFEPRFGEDFGNVRVYTDQAAAQTARAINAKALTTDNCIAFDTAQYTPETADGKELLAHELTHVVQQRKASYNLLKVMRVDAKTEATPLKMELPYPEIIIMGMSNKKYGHVAMAIFNKDGKYNYYSWGLMNHKKGVHAKKEGSYDDIMKLAKDFGYDKAFELLSDPEKGLLIDTQLLIKNADIYFDHKKSQFPYFSFDENNCAQNVLRTLKKGINEEFFKDIDENIKWLPCNIFDALQNQAEKYNITTKNTLGIESLNIIWKLPWFIDKIKEYDDGIGIQTTLSDYLFEIPDW